MDMKRAFQIAAPVLLVAMLTGWSAAQVEHSSYDPGVQQVRSKQRNGLLDFTLKRINPADIDYGKLLSEDRAFLLDETLSNRYFWSNVIAIGLLVCLFTVIVYQHQTHATQEQSTAETLAEYEHSLARAIEQAENAYSNNNSLKETLTVLRESVLRSPGPPPDSVERAQSSKLNKDRPPTSAPAADSVERTPPSKLNKDRPPSPQPIVGERAGNGLAKPTHERPAIATTATDGVNQMRLFTPDTDLIMRVNSLEQQLSQTQEDNKQLRRRISDGDRRLNTEQAKNRQLKGA
jgi:hypothetical protein